MEIVLDVFEQSDKYHQYKLQELGKILASDRYGLVAGVIDITPVLDELKILVRNLYALTPQGTVMVVDALEQSFSAQQDGYILIQPKGYKVTEADGISYETPIYDCICTRDVADGIIIGKIANGHLEESYIPPCYRIDASSNLKKVYEDCIRLLPAIEMKMKEKKIAGDTTLFELLEIELCQYNLRESPKELYILLTKIVYCLHKLHPAPLLPRLAVFDDRKIGEEILPMKEFLRVFYSELDNVIEPKREEIVEPKVEEVVEEMPVGREYEFRI